MADFFSMGGYAAFVWPAFLASIAVLVGLAARSLSAYRAEQRRLAAAEGRGDGGRAASQETSVRLLFLLPLALFTALAVGLYVALRSGGDDALPSPLIGKEPLAFDLPLLKDDGGVDEAARLANADLKVGRVTVVNFWASWCGPCKIEHPQLMALSQRPDIALYGIAYKDEAAEARAFLDDLGNPFARVALDDTGRVGIDWGLTGVPETFVLDGAGTVVFKHTGPLTADDLRRRLLPAIAAAAASGGAR